jgi:hypothetical protein
MRPGRGGCDGELGGVFEALHLGGEGGDACGVLGAGGQVGALIRVGDEVEELRAVDLRVADEFVAVVVAGGVLT